MSESGFELPANGARIGDDHIVIDCDIAIVGAGIGGATLAWALRDSGARVLVVEQGDFLPRERENWSARAVHRFGRYKNSAAWVDGETGREFVPGNYHYVGGSSKFYGATMPRLRETDFSEVRLRDGVSPAWPVEYATMEPWYCAAERLYWVHGDSGDPTEPPRSNDYPYPALPHEPPIAKVAASFARQGLHPFPLPQAVDWRTGGRCVLCRTCDSYPCMVDAKGDADVCAMRPALRSPTVKLLTRAEVCRIATDASARTVTGLEGRVDGRPLTVRAERYVVAAGAVNTAALLLRTRSEAAPNGLANSSGQVGRNYMAHVSSFVVGARPGREHHLQFEKTLGLNDWYLAGPGRPFPLGNVQCLGKLQGETIKPWRHWVPLGLLEWITRRSIDFFVETEDLPRPENRVEVDAADRIRLTWRPTNVESHRELVKLTSRSLRRAGYPFIFTQQLGVAATSHQCGTARMGEDPSTSVVDPLCRCHDVENLWIVDASVFPSSAAVNPALTIAATALRVAAEGRVAQTGVEVSNLTDELDEPVGKTTRADQIAERTRDRPGL
jgi:choline dehydrogenase-like flavoprotein